MFLQIVSVLGQKRPSQGERGDERERDGRRNRHMDRHRVGAGRKRALCQRKRERQREGRGKGHEKHRPSERETWRDPLAALCFGRLSCSAARPLLHPIPGGWVGRKRRGERVGGRENAGKGTGQLQLALVNGSSGTCGVRRARA